MVLMVFSICSAYALVRTKSKRFADENHGMVFRTIVHAVHRQSWRTFELRVIRKWESYHLNHFRSHVWDVEDNKRHGLQDHRHKT